MRPRLCGIMAILCSCALAAGAQTKPGLTARDVWAKSRTQGMKTPIKATLAVTAWDENGQVETRSLIVRDGKGRTRTEYLVPPNDKGRIVILDGSTRWQYEPKRNLLVKSPFDMSLADTVQGDEKIALNEYRLSFASKPATLSGRRCYVLTLTPNHAGIGTQTRWIDTQTFTTLQTNTRYSDGSPASRVTYADVQWNAAVKPSDFIPPSALGTKTIRQSVLNPKQTAAEMEKLAHAQGLMTDTPLGFRLRRVLTQPKGKSSSKHFLYSDGLFFLSIFVEEGFGENAASRPPCKPVQIVKLTAH